MKDLTLALELCAFALATVLVRHVSTEKNLKEYFNSEELAIEVKDLENGASEQYLVDPKALHQGIRAFKRALTVSNYDFLVLAQRESSDYILHSFHELSAVKTGWSLKFPGISNDMTGISSDSIYSQILAWRDNLLKLSHYEKSVFKDIRLVYHELNKLQMEKEAIERAALTTPVVYRQRKKTSDLSTKYLETIISDVISEVENKYSSDRPDSSVILKTFESVSSRKIRKFGSVVNNLFAVENNSAKDSANKENLVPNVTESDGRSDESDGFNDDDIDNSLNNLPNKKVKYTKVEKEGVLNVFDAVKARYLEKGTPMKDARIASKVKKMLVVKGGYCTLHPMNILNWMKMRNKKHRVKGKKIDKSFEAEVLGNVMICMYEKSSSVS